MTAAPRPPLSDESLSAHLDAAAGFLGIAVEAEWRPSILAHLRATLQAGNFVAEFPLEDELEPAPAFSA